MHAFVTGKWNKDIDVRDFIQKNYTPYVGDSSFLTNSSQRTQQLWQQVEKLMRKEHKEGLTSDTDLPSSIMSHPIGYIDESLEQIVGLQTETPLKCGIMPRGGYRNLESSLKAYGLAPSSDLKKIFTKYCKTHNDGVFDVYTKNMLAARKSGIITGLPDAYGRGRIIGDYRRLALYGIDYLIEDKGRQKASLEVDVIDEEIIRLTEEIAGQIRTLYELRDMAKLYGFDISRPAADAKEAIQWTYFGYLAAIKEQNGAAMSLGRTSTFFDIFIERDIKNGCLTEEAAQELVDHFVMKLRMVRFLRTPDYNALFSGDPVWITESVGGMGIDGRTLVTKTSFRFLQSLYNLGPAPEPNITILWSEHLPKNFKDFCAKVSIETSSIQYENDDLMHIEYGDDYGIACCVSAMRIGKQMQYFGARVNLAKTLLYAINGGKDEISGQQIGPCLPSITADILDYDLVMQRFDSMMDWLARLYINTLNVIHYMHDKYAYEYIQMALHDRDVHRTMACGIAGLSVVADSLAAIKYSKVKVIRNENGLAIDYVIDGEYPQFGNNDDRVDSIASDIVRLFMDKLRQHKTYRNASVTQSILTITSNVVYGKKTGSTPDGRKYGEPFAPGANPLHGRDKNGIIASLASVAKLPYQCAIDGISNTVSIIAATLGKNNFDQQNNLVQILDGYFSQNAHHLNVNILSKEILIDAMKNPDNYLSLTVRVSGYAVKFTKLTKEQQEEVISRTFHDKL